MYLRTSACIGSNAFRIVLLSFKLSFWVVISIFGIVLLSFKLSFWVADSLFWVVESLFWVVESLFWIVSLSFKASFWIVTSLFWAVSLSFKAPFWIVERSLGVPTEKAKDPPWFAVQMGSVADSVAAKIRIIFDNTNFSARKIMQKWIFLEYLFYLSKI